MKNLDKYLSLLDGEVDGLLLTSRYSRHYGAEFDIAEGVAIVTKKGSRYFTDSRYIESAQKNLKGFEVLEMTREHSFVQLLNEAIADFGVTVLGYEERYLSAEEYFGYEKNLNAKLVPFNEPIYAFRGTKEDWEIALMRKAQAITDKAFSEVITRIRPGMTELELQAELIYCMYKNGGTGLAFDPIVVSGPNTSLPHGVAGERAIQPGDFVTMDFGASYMGYCSDMTRTVAVGYATEEMKQVYAVVLKAQEDAIAATKAGVPGQVIDGGGKLRQFPGGGFALDPGLVIPGGDLPGGFRDPDNGVGDMPGQQIAGCACRQYGDQSHGDQHLIQRIQKAEVPFRHGVGAVIPNRSRSHLNAIAHKIVMGFHIAPFFLGVDLLHPLGHGLHELPTLRHIVILSIPYGLSVQIVYLDDVPLTQGRHAVTVNELHVPAGGKGAVLLGKAQSNGIGVFLLLLLQVRLILPADAAVCAHEDKGHRQQYDAYKAQGQLGAQLPLHAFPPSR